MLKVKPIYMDKEKLILRTKPCNWGKCYFCAFEQDTDKLITIDNLENQIKFYFSHFTPSYLKVFNSGSFFDEAQVGSFYYLLMLFKSFGVEKIRVESRPYFLSGIYDVPKGINIEIMVGLETTNLELLRKINKDIEPSHYLFQLLQAIDFFKFRKNFQLGCYLLVKPCIMTDKEAFEIIEHDLKFCLELPIFEILVMVAQPRVGSRMWEDYISEKYSMFSVDLYNELKNKYGNKERLIFQDYPRVPRIPS